MLLEALRWLALQRGEYVDQLVDLVEGMPNLKKVDIGLTYGVDLERLRGVYEIKGVALKWRRMFD